MAYAYIHLVDELGNFILDGQGNKIIVDQLTIPDEIISYFNQGDASGEDTLIYNRGRSTAVNIRHRPRSVMSWRIKEVNNQYMTIFNERQLGGIWDSPWGAMGQIVGTQTRYGAQDPVITNEISGGINQLSIFFDDDDFTITGSVRNVNIADFGWTGFPRLSMQSRTPGGTWGDAPGTGFIPLVDGEDASVTIPGAYETEYRAVIKEVGGDYNVIGSSIIDLPTQNEFVFIPDKRPMAASLTSISTSSSFYDQRGWSKSQWTVASDPVARTGLYSMMDTHIVPKYDLGLRRFWFWNTGGFANVAFMGNYSHYKWYTSNSWTSMADDAQPADFNANLDGSVKMPPFNDLNNGRQEAWAGMLNEFVSTRPNVELGVYGGYDVPYLDGELDYDTVTMDGTGTYKSRYETPDPSNPEHVEYWRTQANGWTENTPVTAMGFDTGASVADDENQQFFNLLGIKPMFEAVPLIHNGGQDYEIIDDDRYAKAMYFAFYNGGDTASSNSSSDGYWDTRGWQNLDWKAYEAEYGPTEMHFSIQYYSARYTNNATAQEMRDVATQAYALGYVVDVSGVSVTGNAISPAKYVAMGLGTQAEADAMTGTERGEVFNQEVRDFITFIVDMQA